MNFEGLPPGPKGSVFVDLTLEILAKNVKIVTKIYKCFTLRNVTFFIIYEIQIFIYTLYICKMSNKFLFFIPS